MVPVLADVTRTAASDSVEHFRHIAADGDATTHCRRIVQVGTYIFASAKINWGLPFGEEGIYSIP